MSGRFLRLNETSNIAAAIPVDNSKLNTVQKKLSEAIITRKKDNLLAVLFTTFTQCLKSNFSTFLPDSNFLTRINQIGATTKMRIQVEQMMNMPMVMSSNYMK